MERFNKNEKEILYNAILKIDTLAPVFPSPEEAALGIANFWDAFFLESSEKKVTNYLAEKELVYAKLAALRYSLIAMHSPKDHGDIYPLIFSLLIQISNTIIAVIKLADEGLDYQALSLIRNLMELYMTLLTVIESPQKRAELRNAVDAETARKVWHKYFNKKHFIKMLEEYTAPYPMLIASCKMWADETYKELSSFAHNDSFNMFCFSYAVGENETNPLNIWGEYVTRRGYIYQNLVKVIGPADLLLTQMLRDSKIDIGIQALFDDFKQPMSVEVSWIQSLISDVCMALLTEITGNQKTSPNAESYVAFT